MSEQSIHPYFVDKARALFRAAGGDPDASAALAKWAQTARETGDSRDGVIVADTGEILAYTRHSPATPSTPGATYVRAVVHDTDSDIRRREVGLAVGALRRRHQVAAIHVRYSQVCEGSGRVREESR